MSSFLIIPLQATVRVAILTIVGCPPRPRLPSFIACVIIHLHAIIHHDRMPSHVHAGLAVARGPGVDICTIASHCLYHLIALLVPSHHFLSVVLFQSPERPPWHPNQAGEKRAVEPVQGCAAALRSFLLASVPANLTPYSVGKYWILPFVCSCYICACPGAALRYLACLLLRRQIARNLV